MLLKRKHYLRNHIKYQYLETLMGNDMTSGRRRRGVQNLPSPPRELLNLLISRIKNIVDLLYKYC